MEAKINIAEILKDKPNGTKLYADAFGELSFDGVVSNKDEIIFTKNKVNTSWCFYNDGKYSKYGESILVPSKEMRNWSKFAWKKGDILVGCAKKIIFDKFTDDTYSYFEGKYCLEQDPYSDYETYRGEDKGLLTKYFHIPERCIAQSYIKNIEERLGGKLNLETLEVEKPHPEFKDGDIITITPQIGNNLIFIFRAKDVEKYYCHAYLDGNIAIVNDDSYCQKDFCTARPSTEEEQKQLFDALAKKGKTWDAEKKAIVDLKPKCKFKPFDRVVTRVDDDAIWTANIFSHIDSYGEYNTIGCVGGYPYCIPYNEETAKLIGTTKDVEV